MLFDIAPVPTSVSLPAVTFPQIRLVIPKSFGDARLQVDENRYLSVEHFTFEEVLKMGQRTYGFTFLGDFLNQNGSPLTKWQNLASRFAIEQLSPGDKQALVIRPMPERADHSEQWVFGREHNGSILIVHVWPPSAHHYICWVTRDLNRKFRVGDA